MIGLRARTLLSGQQGYPSVIDPRPQTIARKALARVRFDRQRTTARPQSFGERVLPTIAPGQLWLIEATQFAVELRPFELDAFIAANVVIYDRELTPFVAASLPLGGYAEPAMAAHRALDRPEFERILRLALDGWSVVRLLDGEFAASDRADRVRRLAAQLRAAGVAAEVPVQLVTDTAGGFEKTDTSLADLAGVLDSVDFDRRVTAVFATRNSGGGGPLHAVVDNGLAG